MENKQEQLKNLELLKKDVLNNKGVIYLLCYDTNKTPRAGVKYIYDLALVLSQNGYNAKILVENKKYNGITWMGDKYDSLEIVSIIDDKPVIKLIDTIIVPEVYSNVLESLANVKATKIMLLQQKEFMFESLNIGARWSTFGFTKCITTSNVLKTYISDVFPETQIYVIPPMISDVFVPSKLPKKPNIALSVRDNLYRKRIISEFYLKYPEFTWVSFRDMVGMNHDDFATILKDCFVSVWVDNESSFGTFPLESMKCHVPVIGKLPFTSPEWIGENGLWCDSIETLVEMLGNYVTAWVDGTDVSEKLIEEFEKTLSIYNNNLTKESITTIFGNFKNRTIEDIDKAIKNLE
jgi:hypothetical protein